MTGPDYPPVNLKPIIIATAIISQKAIILILFDRISLWSWISNLLNEIKFFKNPCDLESKDNTFT